MGGEKQGFPCPACGEPIERICVEEHLNTEWKWVRGDAFDDEESFAVIERWCWCPHCGVNLRAEFGDEGLWHIEKGAE